MLVTMEGSGGLPTIVMVEPVIVTAPEFPAVSVIDVRTSRASERDTGRCIVTQRHRAAAYRGRAISEATGSGLSYPLAPRPEPYY